MTLPRIANALNSFNMRRARSKRWNLTRDSDICLPRVVR